MIVTVSVLLLLLAFALSILSMKLVEYKDKKILYVIPHTEIVIHKHIPSTVNKCEVTINNSCNTVLNISVLYVDIDTLQEVPIYMKVLSGNASTSFVLSKELLQLLPIVKIDVVGSTKNITDACVAIHLEYVVAKYPYSWLAIPSFISMIAGATMLIFVMMYLPIRRVLHTQRPTS